MCLREAIQFPLLKKGDQFVIKRIGAYNMTQWMQFITLRPNVVLIDTRRKSPCDPEKGEYGTDPAAGSHSGTPEIIELVDDQYHPLKSNNDIKLFLKAIPNSYGQVFFSDQRLFALILMVITFFDLYAGLLGFLSVIITNLTGFLLGFDKKTISKGVFGFNSLLVGLGLGIYFQPDLYLILVIIMAAILTLLIAVTLQGVIGKYALPFLSIPFLLSIWIMTLSTKEFSALGISERGIYTFNDLYTIGGDPPGEDV